MNFFLIAVISSALCIQAQDAPSKKPAEGITKNPQADTPSTAKAAKKKSEPAGNPDDPVEKEYEKLVQQDEAALKDVEKWVKEADAFEAKGAPGSRAALAAKIEQRLEPVRKAYLDFIQRNTNHVDARLAYGSFLNEIGETEQAITEWEKVREMAPNNPSAWNNLANIYGHIGPVKKAFQYYEKAIQLDPEEPVYFENLAVTVYMFRKDAMEMYRINEEQAFNKALDLYKQAMKLDPTNLVLATDFAQSYYGIKPMRVDDALDAWQHALTLAKSDTEKQGIYLHFARVELNSGKFEQAQKHLDMVNHPEMKTLKERLQKNLNQKKNPDSGKSLPSASPQASKN